MVKERIEQGLCTNKLPQQMPQYMDKENQSYCETCWTICQLGFSNELSWNYEESETECNCKCSKGAKETKTIVQPF
jgi:hypothetical protein